METVAPSVPTTSTAAPEAGSEDGTGTLIGAIIGASVGALCLIAAIIIAKARKARDRERGRKNGSRRPLDGHGHAWLRSPDTSPPSNQIRTFEREDLEWAYSQSPPCEAPPVGVTRTLVVDDTTDADAVIFAPTRPPIDQAWLQSCGDIDPGMRIPSAQGSPLSLHSVSKLALRTGGVSNRVLHLPPGEASGAVHQRWRDKHGRVELKVAAKDRKYAEAVRLLDNVHMKEVFHRGETGPCLIKPVIQGPKGATFPPGTASVSYFIGRYGTIVLNKGDKRGKDGMSSYLRDVYFPVVEKVEGVSSRWVADSNFEVVWRGDEVWLETELLGFSRKGLAEKWDRFKDRLQQASCLGASAAKATDMLEADTPSGTPLSPTQRGSPLSLEPLGSAKYPVGSIEVNNVTDESLQVMLIPETFLTEEAQARSRNANVGLEVGGQGISAGGGRETSTSRSQQPTFVFSSLTRSTIPAGKTDYLQLPGGAQPFEPQDLPIGEPDDLNRVTKNVVEGHGYDIVNTGTTENKELRFKERIPVDGGLLHSSLLFIRVWSQTSITPLNSSTMRPSVLADSCFWDASVPSKQHINNKILDGMVSNVSTTRALFG